MAWIHEADDTTDVAQLVLRYQEAASAQSQYLIGRRTMDETWEFIGGKRKQTESIEEAALRELDEELADVDPEQADIVRVAEPYPAAVPGNYQLYPVLIELPMSAVETIDETSLSDEHDAVTWITVDEFDEYNTRGQRRALAELGLL